MLTDFEKKVLKSVAYIPKGRISTYKEVATAIGSPGSARAVGNALHKNPDLYKIPCHRVVKSNGRVGGFIKGRGEKIRLLKQEGIDVDNKGAIVNFSKILHILK
jgi:O-6-methylguanine DNA methyltransferase